MNPESSRQPVAARIVFFGKMTNAKQILDDLHRRRKVEDALRSFRRRTRRNVSSALRNFVLAGIFAWLAYSDGVVEQVEGKSVLLFHGCLMLVLCLSLISAGIKELWVDPGDRLILLIAEDYLLRTEVPNSSNQLAGAHEIDRDRSLST